VGTISEREDITCLMMATKPVAVLEQLNAALQAKSANVSGMVEAVTKSSKYINSLRTEEAFHEIFSVAEAKCHEYQLEDIGVPRKRGPPRRYTGEAAAYQAESMEEYYRKTYFEFLDTIVAGLFDRYHPEKSGLGEYLKLERMITS
jgi:hypothetical protein